MTRLNDPEFRKETADQPFTNLIRAMTIASIKNIEVQDDPFIAMIQNTKGTAMATAVWLAGRGAIIPAALWAELGMEPPTND